MLLEQQVPHHVVRDMMGHCSVVVANLYAHSTDEARQQAARTVSVEVDLGGVEEEEATSAPEK